MTSEWLRPIASPSEMEPAFRVLASAPNAMSDNLKGRQAQIKKVHAIDAPVVIAELLRDLWALKYVKKALSQVEEEALRRLTDCFVTEWSVCMDIPVEQAKVKFNELIHEGQNKENDDNSDQK
jgi:RNA polymerase-interacting CarD/CdnL/TRCF family regulator